MWNLQALLRLPRISSPSMEQEVPVSAKRRNLRSSVPKAASRNLLINNNYAIILITLTL